MYTYLRNILINRARVFTHKSLFHWIGEHKYFPFFSTLHVKWQWFVLLPNIFWFFVFSFEPFVVSFAFLSHSICGFCYGYTCLRMICKQRNLLSFVLVRILSNVPFFSSSQRVIVLRSKVRLNVNAVKSLTRTQK